VPGKALRKDPLDMASGGRIGFQPPQPPTPTGMRGVGVRAGIDQTVAVGWSATHVAALLDGLGLHRGQHAKPGAQHLSFGPSIATAALVTAAVRGLLPKHREVLDQLYVAGRSASEAAEALGVPVGTVKSRLHHALCQLRQTLDAQPYWQAAA